jgi:GntR family transcriptional repressor for pyruvate dehydrogenase complex
MRRAYDLSMNERPQEVVFDRLSRTPRLSDTIGDRLLDAILSGRFKVGDALPSERDLGTQFGVSRTVVREAIRTLATRGVVEVQSGRGVRVLPFDGSPVTQAMSLLLRGAPQITFEKVHEVRAMLETHLAAAAAERAGPADIAALEATIVAMAAADDIDEASELDVQFHRLVACSSQNELSVVLLDSIAAVLLEHRRSSLALPHSAERWLEEHREILAAIERRDPEGARAAMEAHLANAAAARETHPAQVS